jgi:hypothetical protein
MMHKDINHSQQNPSFVDCGKSIKEEDKKEKIKENVDDPSSISYSTESYIKEEIKEEVAEGQAGRLSYSYNLNKGQGVDDLNLGTD